jgi:hypothetical protein
LVAEVFHTEKRNVLHCEVAHLDGNRANARADNLKWVSKVENRSHRKRHGTECSGSAHGAAKLSEADVARILSRYADSKTIASDYGISRHTVFAIWQGKNWRHLSSMSVAIAGGKHARA